MGWIAHAGLRERSGGWCGVLILVAAIWLALRGGGLVLAGRLLGRGRPSGVPVLARRLASATPAAVFTAGALFAFQEDWPR